jgi:aminopeptidase YwaD
MDLHEYSRDFVSRCVTDQDAYGVLSVLCEQVGSRLSASDEERRATEMAISQLSRHGCETEISEFSYPGWRPGRSTVLVRERGSVRELASHPLGWCPGTSVSAPVADAGPGMKEDFQTDAIRGKIVLVSDETRPGQKELHRSVKYGLAVEAGAAGFVFYGRRPGGLVAMGAANLDPKTGAIPGVGISYEDAMYLRRKGEAVTLEIASTSTAEPVTSRNGIGLKRGKTAEEIIVCGHIDSWFSEGAVDNGSGIAMIVELARLTRAYNLARSVRFVTFGSEELGLHGSKAYARAHEDLSNVVCVLNLDCSAVREGTLTVTTNENDRFRGFMADMKKQLHTDFYLYDEITRYSDHYSFRQKGVPCAALLSRSPSYAFAHTDYDSLDKVSPESFTVPLLVAGVTLIECAMRDVSFR